MSDTNHTTTTFGFPGAYYYYYYLTTMLCRCSRWSVMCKMHMRERSVGLFRTYTIIRAVLLRHGRFSAKPSLAWVQDFDLTIIFCFHTIITRLVDLYQLINFQPPCFDMCSTMCKKSYRRRIYKICYNNEISRCIAQSAYNVITKL